MSGAVGWIVDALIASTLLMGAVLLARGPVRRAFGPQVAYALWALPLLRFFLPSLPAGWWQSAAATPVSYAGETITVLVVEPASVVAAAPAPSVWLGLTLALAWAGGAAAFLLFHMARHRRFCRRMLADAQGMEQADGVTVFASAAAPGPLAFGVWRRYVAFPRDFADRYDAEERALALAHELGHHARRDLLANWAALAVLALHWFNPLAWRAFHAFRADQELANDARVLAGRGPEARHAYGRAIVKAAHGGAVSAACHLHTISDLKGRLRMLTTSRASGRRLLVGTAAVSLLTAAGLGVTASSSSAAEALTDTVTEAIEATTTTTTQASAPAVLPAPATPDAPAVTPKAADAKRPIRRVVVVKDGEAKVYEGRDAETYARENNLAVPPVPPVPPVSTFVTVRPPRPIPGMTHGFVGNGTMTKAWRIQVPELVNGTCPGDAKKPVVEHSQKNGRERITICANRIDFTTREAERVAANSAVIEREAIAHARSGLALARTSIANDRNLSDEQRREALAGIAEAEAELRDKDKD